jgi:hypothetical protein
VCCLVQAQTSGRSATVRCSASGSDNGAGLRATQVDLAVDEELVAENSVCIEQIELQQSGLVIEDLVVEDHVDIETGQRVLSVAEARQTEAGVFVTSVEFIEENVSAGEAFVGVLGGVIDAVVVIPQRMHRFLDVARAGMR